MSFSQKIKDEILQNKLTKGCCNISLRYGELSTETKMIAIPEDVLSNIRTNNCCMKAYIKGVFLGSGCIVNPENDYHFEVTFKSKKLAEMAMTILNEFDINSKLLKRATNQYVVYVKDSEEISVILRILEVNKCLLDYENIRVEKSIKNDINRNINCETANMAKTVNTAILQIEAINKIIDSGYYPALPLELQEICTVRKQYPDLSLADLALKCNKRISKSGVNHRLNKILKFAGKL